MRQLLPETSVFSTRADYRRLYIGQFISGFGSALTYVVLPLQLYQLTRSPLSVGLLGLVEFLPMFTLAFVGGALADRLDRKQLVAWSETAMATICLLLALNAFRSDPLEWPIWFGASSLAALGAIHRPAMEAMTQQIVPMDQMPAVAAWNSLRHNFAHIAGPGLAGVIAATWGVGVAFLVDAATYLFSVAMILRMGALPRISSDEEPLTWHTLMEGWRYAQKRQDLLGTYFVDFVAMFFGMPNALFPALGERWGAPSVGFLYAAPAVGALLASLTSRWTQAIRRHGLAITLAASVWGIAITAFGMSSSLPVALLFLAVAGGADNISGIFRMTMWNQTIPHRLRGRTAAIEMVSYLSGPYLGNAEAGLAAQWLGLRRAVTAGGLLCILGCGVVAGLLPGFAKYDSREGIRRREAEDAALERV